MSKYILIEQSHEFLEEKDPIDKLAYVAHNCYQVSEQGHKANFEFIKRLIANKHFAMLEHYVFTFKVTDKEFLKELILNNFKFLIITDDVLSYSLRGALDIYLEKKTEEIGATLLSALDEEIVTLINEAYSTSLQKDNSKLERIDPLTLPLEIRKEHLFVSLKLITNRGITHELVRHRLASFAQESTRYCNYTKNKFSNTLTFITPTDYETNKDVYDAYFQYESDSYFELINRKCPPDIARNVLSNALKATLIMTCSLSEWEHVFELRVSPFAHKEVRDLLSPVQEEIKERYYK